LFADYVRMIRGNKAVDWSTRLAPEDLALIQARVDPAAWYPMASFERMGDAILQTVAGGSLDAVRLWGRFSVDQLAAAQPQLVAHGDPIETMNRFRVLRATYFDFEALEINNVCDGEAHVLIAYYMGPSAEEAASYQTMGFFERLLEVAGAKNVFAQFTEQSWAGAPRTRLELRWHDDAPPPRRASSTDVLGRIKGR
jgi:hypothetical protein